LEQSVEDSALSLGDASIQVIASARLNEEYFLFLYKRKKFSFPHYVLHKLQGEKEKLNPSYLRERNEACDLLKSRDAPSGRRAQYFQYI
jgi:hypothetical protein